ncbi:MAG: glycosyltransferase family 4 protein [Moorea sp. SIOASIH]|uniref:glycosyltransferase n=1 Tax=Moorena sp. SIOASIH TaxID=2607817 RepID=UPI0013BB945A|nr:glycosyltransferase [Moorena sp. SIOASIH]NEO38735.1 glycosyltransferase family 4 protein [Moorena sp. SIOASIH]
MRIYISSNHQYPAKINGTASQHTTDLLAKGLAELGHDVFYDLRNNEILEPLPDSVNQVTERMFDVDILQPQDIPPSRAFDSHGKPWVRTFQAPFGNHDVSGLSKENLIFVSRSHAQSYGCDRYVHNSIDPAEFIYSETKDDYFIFLVCGLERAVLKGFGIALLLVQELGIKLVVAGSSKNEFYQRQFAAMCREQGVDFVGEIRGPQKAQLIASAKALLAPTLINEPFGLVVPEALISGTPVICSHHGAFKEIVSSDVGFICHRQKDYIAAVERLDEISPQACREKAMRDFHYRTMAANYLKEYEKEISLTVSNNG